MKMVGVNTILKSHTSSHRVTGEPMLEGFRRSSDPSFCEIITCSYSEAHLAVVLGNWFSMVLLEQSLDQMVSRGSCKLQLFCHAMVRAVTVNSCDQSRKIVFFCVTYGQ